MADTEEADTEEKVIWPEDLNEWQQVHLAIGEYFVAFSNLEGTLTLFTSRTLGLPYSTVAFLTRDMPFSLKSKLFRRAGAEFLTSESASKLNVILNRANKAAEFRNELAHGAFVHDDQKGITLVKDGNSSAKVWEGRESIDYDTVAAKTAELHMIGGLFSTWSLSTRKLSK